MKINRRANSIGLLRWTLGPVLLRESGRFAFSGSEAQRLVRMGLPSWAGPVPGGLEILAAVMFPIPKLGRIGGSLLVTFAIAAAMHVLHGQFQIGSLIVYGAAVFTCIHRSSRLAREATS